VKGNQVLRFVQDDKAFWCMTKKSPKRAAADGGTTKPSPARTI
jgi:hypothetical protein